MDVFTEPFYMRVGAGIVHTLNGAIRAWQQVSLKDSSSFMTGSVYTLSGAVYA